MKKICLTFVLIFLCGIWMSSNAICVALALHTNSTLTETFYGVLMSAAMPCNPNAEEDPCMPCLTLALQTTDTIYYLTSDNDKTFKQLEEIELQLVADTPVLVRGIPYEKDNFNYINVKEISLNEQRTYIENISGSLSIRKIVSNGQILIERNGKTYTLTGGEWSDGPTTYRTCNRHVSDCVRRNGKLACK